MTVGWNITKFSCLYLKFLVLIGSATENPKKENSSYDDKNKLLYVENIMHIRENCVVNWRGKITSSNKIM